MSFDFSGFDRATSAVMIVSTEMRMVYSNAVARRQIPFLAADPEGLFSRYGKDALEKLSLALRNGQASSLAYDENLHLSLLFTPSFLSDGSFSHAYVNVVSDGDLPAGTGLLLSDGELLTSLLQSAVKPVNIALRQLQVAGQFNTVADLEKLIQTVLMVRRQLLQASLFFARVEDCSGPKGGTCAVSDAAAALSTCNESCKIMKFKPSGTCYVPMERQSVVLLCADVLTDLYFHQKQPKVTVSATSSEKGVTLAFTSGPLDIPLDVPCDPDFDGIDLGMFSVRRRVELAGGKTVIRSRPHGVVTVELKFPPVRLDPQGAVFGDFHGSGVSSVEMYALQYLSLICGQN